MILLFTLIATFGLISFVFRKDPKPALAGRIALAVMLVLTGTAHFTQTEALTPMVPPIFPGPERIVYLTGVVELLFAVLLVVRSTALLGWALAAFFVALLPANVYSALAGVGLGGQQGPAYLVFRVPLQLLFIGWGLLCTGAVRWRGRRLDGGRRIELSWPRRVRHS